MKSIDTPLVSIGIPTFGRPEGLARTLQYLISQTYENLEIIVSDNDTPGPTVGLIVKSLSERDSRIKFYQQPKNIGRIDNFRFVLSQASGEFFMWAADDDEWDENFIRRCVETIGSRGSVMCGFDTHFRASGRSEHNALPILDSSSPAYENANSFLRLMQPSLFYGLHRRKDIQFFLTDKFFDFYDCYFILRLILDCGFTTFQDVLYTAGVDAPDYEVKFASPEQGGKLDYVTVVYVSLLHIMCSHALGLSQKLSLSRNFLDVILSQIRHHERLEKPIRWLAGQFFDRFARRLKSFLPKVSGDGTSGKAIEIQSHEANACLSYSQSGEDLIIAFIFQAMRIENPSYLDIGAHHPSYLSNTYLFYRRGSKGVCIEADPSLCEVFPLARPKDISLNVGIGDAVSKGEKFYIMSSPSLNTFSREEAERYESLGSHRIQKILDVPITTVHQVIEKYFWGQSPNLISIDVEGLDLKILESIDFSRYRPQVVCVETLTYSESRQETKISEIIRHMEANGYFVYADTYINTIFADSHSWHNK